MRTYGPSNWRERPDETRSYIYKHESAPGKNDGLKYFAIWTARDLMREQAKMALERGENSPDSLWAVVDGMHKLYDPMGNKKSEAREWLQEYLPLIKDGVNRYGNLPQNLVAEKAHPRIQGNPSRVSRYVLEQLETMNDDLLEDYYIWEKISGMLELVAEYEDGTARGRN